MCQNDGVCSKPNVCDCPPGYTGAHCETRMSLIVFNYRSVHHVMNFIVTFFFFSLAICNPECQNGGVCSQPDVCDCPAGYSGDRCETRMLQILLFFQIILYTM